MINKIKRRLGRGEPVRQLASYSQSGEDILIEYVLGWMGIKTRTYLDIGAHHPTYLSNTYLFYTHGARGVSVEPDSTLHAVIAKQRPEDTNLNIGVGKKRQSAKFYIMHPTTLNTFSKKEAETYCVRYPEAKITDTVSLPVVPVNEIIAEHFPKAAPDLVSIDVEGLDLEIVESFDFKRSRPTVFCIETVEYEGETVLRKATKLINKMKAQDYFIYADTFTNTIFVDRKAWKAAKLPEVK